MTDNLGLNQTRVLDSSNRSFEAVIFQKKKPPLSCEWNLEGNLVAEHSQDVSQLVGPSGWVSVGYINDNTIENTARVGDVITSPNYPANSFRLMATDQGVLTGTLSAWVNGMKVLVQGTNSLTDENNLIQLGAPPTTTGRVDFVFLEVWRKLIGVSDVVYSHGNVLYGGVNYINDLVDPAVNVETSLRIQVQYRIRVISDVDIGTFPEGFGPNVYAQGPLSSPSTCTGANFTQVPGDPGLWRAGLGDSASQETLNTVDGYTYAIPMFAVTRRNTNAFSNAHVNGAGFALADYLNGVISDRPDNLYNNWIVADDIMDMRKTIKADNLKETCNKAFQKLINGDLRGVMSYQNIGEDHYGDVLMQVDGINPLPNPNPIWFTNIGTGDGLRRVFSSASVLQNRTLISMDPPGGTWTSTPFTISPSITDPPGTLIQLLAIWIQSSSTPIVPGDFSATVGWTDIITVIPEGAFLGQTYRITISYEAQYPSGEYGLSALPANVYETRRSDSTIAFPPVGSTIPLHGSSNFIYADQTYSKAITVPSVDPSTLYNFSTQMIYYITSSGASAFTIPRNIMGYEVLGIVSVYDPIGISYKDLSLSTAVSRNATEYTVTYGGIAIDAGQPIRVVLYLGASNINSTVMSKFFQTNNQGKSITNIYEMREIQATSITSTSFFVDTTTEEILALASGLDLGGAGIAYDSNGIRCLTQITNASLPMPTGDAQTDATCSRLYMDFAIAPATPITVPVLVSSPLISSDSYQIYYKTVPYQGLLNNSGTYGTIEAEGPALITTSGSGMITPSFNPENVIDRLPTLYPSNDAMALNEDISTAVSDHYPVLETRIVSRPNDIIDKPADSVTIGLYPAGRGKSGVSVSDSTYLGLKFEKLDTTGSYQKAYQSYILNKEGKGELYLMVVGSETGNDSSSQYLGSSDDSVDIFQLPGRPIKNGKSV